MSIAVTPDQRELAAAVRDWAASLDGPAAVRAAEGQPEADFADVMKQVEEFGLCTIARPETDGGGGGSVVDQAVALEAAAYALVPGPVLATALGLAEQPAHETLDLSRRGPLSLPASPLAVALASAEASGVARWCLDTAVAHAKVREQFGAPIGSFQAVKQLCAEMLETAEAVTAAAWDAAVAVGGDDEQQAAYAAAVAGTTCFEGAVQVARGCIQVLGGIGFTFEHDAHLYLRRALALRALTGGADRWAARLADLATSGVRREAAVDVPPEAEARREEVRTLVAAGDPRVVAPHWPAPYGLDAVAGLQLVVDQELTRAGVERRDLKIGAWAVPTILAHGSDAQRERFVGPTLAGEITWCQLFSEPEAGSDLASLRTRAVRDDAAGGWRLTGQKVWTSLAHEADWAICLARTDAAAPDAGARPHAGITYFLVDMTSDGLDIRPLREMTGDAMFNEVFLDDVLVPDDCVVGEVGDGWRLARTTLSNERVAMGSSRLEASVERALELVGDDPVERVRVGRAVALAAVCQLLTRRTTLRSLAGAGPGPESSVGKLLGVRSRQEASDLVVELLGSRALEPGAEAEVHELLLTRCLSIAGGTTQILRNVAAERILGLPR